MVDTATMFFCNFLPTLFWWEFWVIIIANLGYGALVDGRLIKDAMSMRPMLPTFSRHGYGAVVYYASSAVFILTFLCAAICC